MIKSKVFKDKITFVIWKEGTKKTDGAIIFPAIEEKDIQDVLDIKKSSIVFLKTFKPRKTLLVSLKKNKTLRQFASKLLFDVFDKKS